MSIVERSASPQALASASKPLGDRLRVVTAGDVGSMEARLGASGFEVVAVAETEHALIDAVSDGEPDAIVVEADLCVSLEHVRDLAPGAVLIVVGDHTPAGALGRIEEGVSGTVMAGLLHALVAEGVGAAAVWGLVPAFGPGPGQLVSQRVGGWLLSAKADLLRAHLENALRGHAELATAAGIVAVTFFASLLLTLSAPRTHDDPARIPSPTPAVERSPQDLVGDTPSTPPIPDYRLSIYEGEPGPPGDRPGPNRGTSAERGRHDEPRSDARRPPGVAYGWDHRPPKHADDGRHTGWRNNSVPEDLPPGSNSVPDDRPPGSGSVADDPPGRANQGGRGQSAAPPCAPAAAPCHGR